jgi:hypothetical protein
MVVKFLPALLLLTQTKTKFRINNQRIKNYTYIFKGVQQTGKIRETLPQADCFLMTYRRLRGGGSRDPGVSFLQPCREHSVRIELERVGCPSKLILIRNNQKRNYDP